MALKGRVRSIWMVLVVLCVLPPGIVLASATPLWAAPQAEAEVIRRVQMMSNDEVARRLLASGLTRAEVREQLRRAGYDPYLADHFFEAMVQGTQVPGELDVTSFDAFQQIGIIDPQDLLTTATRPELSDSASASDDTDEALGEPPVFGSGVFFTRSLRFDPFLSGPVGDDYRLGPGDAISLMLTGDVERVHERLIVSRSGDVFIPVVGLVGVQGRTLGEVRDLLYSRLGQVYGSIRREAGATTTFTVTVATLRVIQVRVLGAVVRPGAYQLSSLGTLLQALYYAGGPTDEGSYRRLVLSRPGEEPREVDTYPYLHSGATSGDPRLQSGDVVFVPPVGKQATITGAVRREAVYELLEGEGLRELVDYAGGLLPEASTKYAQVNRVLSPPERSNDIERVVVNAALDSVLAGTASFDISPGDEVRVFSVPDDVRNTVEIAGGVRLPGTYEWVPGMTVATALERAGGLASDAQGDRIRLLRLNRSTRTYFMFSNQTSLNTEVADGDVLEVFTHRDFVVEDSVEIYGMVVNPGRYAFAAGMTVGDLILSAGGFVSDAYTRTVEVARRNEKVVTPTATSTTVWIDSVFAGISGTSVSPLPADAVTESEFPLRADDRVFVRRDPTSRTAGLAMLTGEIRTPGRYALLEHGERLSSLTSRAGGLTELANPAGLQLIRQGIFVGVDFFMAQTMPGTVADPVIQPGDSIHVPVVDNTVTVGGSVNFPSRVVFRPGMTVTDVLESAGGATRDADLDRTSVAYANGDRATAWKRLGLFRSYPEVREGSSIFVPIEETDGINWGEAIGTAATVLHAVAINVVAIMSLVQSNNN